MGYDWTKHANRSTIEGREVEGGGGPRAGGLQKTLQPKGFLKLNSGFSFLIDSYSYFTDDEAAYVLELLEFIHDIDEEFPMLTTYNRRNLRYILEFAQRNSEAAQSVGDE